MHVCHTKVLCYRSLQPSLWHLLTSDAIKHSTQAAGLVLPLPHPHPAAARTDVTGRAGASNAREVTRPGWAPPRPHCLTRHRRDPSATRWNFPGAVPALLSGLMGRGDLRRPVYFSSRSASLCGPLPQQPIGPFWKQLGLPTPAQRGLVPAGIHLPNIIFRYVLHPVTHCQGAEKDH